MNEKHPIADLPFVADRVPDKVNPKGRCFWSVTPTGDYVADCRTGNSYALAYLRYQRNDPDGIPFLPTIVTDMPRDITGLEVGFLGLIDRAAQAGLEEAERLDAHWKARRAADKAEKRAKKERRARRKSRPKLRLVQGGLREAQS